MNTAIIVAAGSGRRFNSDIPKQFLELNGKPVILHTIERFQAAPSIDSIVLVLAADQLERFEALGPKPATLLSVVSGGHTRAASVWNGIAALPAGCEIVVVHDGARPLVPVDDIERTVAKATVSGAACLVASVTDTIKTVLGGEITATLDREKLRRALTPQAFRLELLKRSYEAADLDDPAITDECYLVEKMGHPVIIVEGSPVNIKITHRHDLSLAEALLETTAPLLQENGGGC